MMKTLRSPAFLLLLVLTVLIFGLNLYLTGTHQNRVSKDFALYIHFAEPMKHLGTLTTPHFIYPLLLALLSLLLPGLGYSAIGAGIVLAFDLLLAFVLWRFWERMVPTPSFVPVSLTIATMLIAPVTLLLFIDHHSYFGYIGITIFHNPTLLICRPIALLHFLIVGGVLASRNPTVRKTLLAAVLLITATLMKPNYALIAIPAASVFAIVAAIEKDWRVLKFIVLGTIIPGILILAWQYVFTYIYPDSQLGSSQIIFAPLFVYSDRSHYVLLKLVLSALFPLAVLAVYRREVLRDRFYLFAFVLFLAGVAQSYLFAEAGTRLYDGNFLWSAQLGLFLWFLASMRVVLLRLLSTSGTPRWTTATLVLAGIFSLHLASGVLWYFHETFAPGAFW